jgi:cell division septum initiation protein DivIVA
MRTELERFRAERDQFKLMAETIQMRYSAIKNSLENSGNEIGFEGTSSTLGYLLNQSREKNMALQTETEALRQKLNELQGDIKLLRNKNVEMSKVIKSKAASKDLENDEALKAWNEEKSKLIDQLEGLKKKNAHLQFDFRSLLDEKEEIVNERDAYKCKAHRLNHELNVALKSDGMIDFDSLILENKFLHDRIDNLQKEIEHSKQSQEKLQTILKAKRVKGAIKFEHNSNNQLVMSHKQGNFKTFVQS